jgi:Tfp pilus assembly protein PilP
VTKNKKVRRKHNHFFLQAIMLMVACGISSGIGACSKTAETPKKPEPAKPAVVATPEKKTAGADKKLSPPSPADEQKAGAEFTYDPAGKPDPFAPLVTEMPASKQPPSAALPESELTPLQKYDLSELILVAIILQNNVEPTAMVEDKAGYGYILKKGMLIGKNNGIIKEITTNDVVIDESTIDAAGVKKSKTVTLTITKNMLGEK